MPPAPFRYFHHIRTHVRPNGERFPTVFDETGVPAHYATCLMLNLRSKNAAALTMEAAATDLVHLGQALDFEGLSDLNTRLEHGRYLDDFAIEALVEAMGLQTSLLRKLNNPKVIHVARSRMLKKAPATVNPTKARRITTMARYIDLVARTGEAQADPKERRKRSKRRLEMFKYFSWRYDPKAAHHASEIR